MKKLDKQALVGAIVATFACVLAALGFIALVTVYPQVLLAIIVLVMFSVFTSIFYNLFKKES